MSQHSNFSSSSRESRDPLGDSGSGFGAQDSDIFRSAVVQSYNASFLRDSDMGPSDSDEDDEFRDTRPRNPQAAFPPQQQTIAAVSSNPATENTVPLLGGSPRKGTFLIRPPLHVETDSSEEEEAELEIDDEEENAPFLGLQTLGPASQWRRTRVWSLAVLYYAAFLLDTCMLVWFWRNSEHVGSIYAWTCAAFLLMGFVFQCAITMLRVCHHEDFNGSRACVLPLLLCLTNTYMLRETLELTGLLKGRCRLGLPLTAEEANARQAVDPAEEPFGDVPGSVDVSDFWSIRRLQSATQSLPMALLYSFFLFSWIPSEDLFVSLPVTLLTLGIVVAFLSAGLGLRRMLMFSYQMGFRRTMVFLSGFALELVLFMSMSAAFGNMAFFILFAKIIVVAMILAPLKDLNVKLFGTSQPQPGDTDLEGSAGVPSSGIAAIISQAPLSVRPNQLNINTLDLVLRVTLSGPCFYSYFRPWFLQSELKVIALLGAVDAGFFALCCVFWSFFSGVWGSCGWILFTLFLSFSVTHFFLFIFLIRRSPPTQRR